MPRKAWAWTPWQYATDGRFSGRWDDPDGLWRSRYVGGSRLACYVEVLAVFRPDPVLSLELDNIDEQPEDAAEHPTLGLGLLPRAWLEPRRLGTATLHGWYAVPGASQSLPTLRARFLALARSLGLPDLDGAAIRLAEPRRLTQHLTGWLYQQTGPDGTPLTGVQFASRHGRRTRAVGGVRTRRRHHQLRPAARQHQRSARPARPRAHPSPAAPPTHLDRLTRHAPPLQAAACPVAGKTAGPARAEAAPAAQLPEHEADVAGRYRSGSSSGPESMGTGPGKCSAWSVRVSCWRHQAWKDSKVLWPTKARAPVVSR